MLKIAITGNIASGKSQVENILIDLNYKVADTDKINHDILKNDIDTINEIKNAFFSEDITDENNDISREKLGKIVFSDNSKKTLLEKILHKRINEKVNEFFEENKNEKITFVSIPLLFETNQQKNFDKIIFISADEKLRLQRLIKRNNYSVEYAIKRIKSQESEEQKIKKSDFIVYNNSDFKNLENQISAVLKKLTNQVF